MSFLDYAARGHNAGWRYVLALSLGVILGMFVGALLVVAVQSSGMLPRGWLVAARDPGQPVSFFLFNGVVFGLLLLGVALAVRRIQGKRPADLVGWWSWRLFGLGAGVWLVALTVAALVDFAIAPSGFRFSAGDDTPRLVVAALAGLAIQVFAEEFIFRGHITQGLMLAIRRPLPAALLSGVIFGAIHIPNGTVQAASATASGVLLALIAIKTRGIAFTSGLHLVNNVFAAVVVVSAGDVFRGSPGFFSQDTPHLMWWDTGVGILLFLLVTIFVYRRRWLPDPSATTQGP
ncbi:CPBP family intramembrane glutamic endopeptidase [uncultured Phenylobacterium sp.]|uniref:CPBP family intramembrane glutamic endopeptidase n=1 Tax=uncultured Phenylobacterium sp. TaxID=349273 RepID=UPI0025F264C7|nr:CPBP family intramembrane glutamic endopeptidase [uncultured Phenylobacterium sp.]